MSLVTRTFTIGFFNLVLRSGKTPTSKLAYNSLLPSVDKLANQRAANLMTSPPNYLTVGRIWHSFNSISKSRVLNLNALCENDNTVTKYIDQTSFKSQYPKVSSQIY